MDLIYPAQRKLQQQQLREMTTSINRTLVLPTPLPKRQLLLTKTYQLPLQTTTTTTPTLLTKVLQTNISPVFRYFRFFGTQIKILIVVKVQTLVGISPS